MTNISLTDILFDWVDDGSRGNGGQPYVTVLQIATLVTYGYLPEVDLECDIYADPDGSDPMYAEDLMAITSFSFPNESDVALFSDGVSWLFPHDHVLPAYIPGVTTGSFQSQSDS